MPKGAAAKMVAHAAGRGAAGQGDARAGPHASLGASSRIRANAGEYLGKSAGVGRPRRKDYGEVSAAHMINELFFHKQGGPPTGARLAAATKSLGGHQSLAKSVARTTRVRSDPGDAVGGETETPTGR